MALGWGKKTRKVVLGLAILLACGWILPSLFSAERYRRRMEAGLERALHRPVRFGAIAVRLLPRPGFTIKDLVVREDPAFTSEPLAQIDRVECDLGWRTLWRSGVECSRLRLGRASFNFVRSARGEWSVGNVIRASAVATPVGVAARPAGDLTLETEDARLNFIVGSDKKPFAVIGVRARVEFDRVGRTVRFALAGRPVRTDLLLPSPGMVELEGEWVPGGDLDGPFNATLRTSGSLLYNWVPLLTGRNPGIYGVLDGQFRLQGLAGVMKADGELRLSQLHRWEEIPPADAALVMVHSRGELDRNRGRVVLESMDVSFLESRLHLSGTVENIPGSPQLDLVAALERSRLEDLLKLSHHLGAKSLPLTATGRVDGLLSVHGPWTSRHYGGFLNARDVRLRAAAWTIPASEIAVRVDDRGARLAPVRLTLAPHIELVAEGGLRRQGLGGGRSRGAKPPQYDLALSAKALPLQELARLARALDVRAAQNLDAQGLATVSVRLTGRAWPFARPVLTGHAQLQAARLLVPGLTEPLNVPSAHVELKGGAIVADRLVAVIGTSVFQGRVEHRGNWKEPWRFKLGANALSIDQAALWFEPLGLRKRTPLVQRLPRAGSLATRRVPASNILDALNASGSFSAGVVTCRALVLRDFRASVEVSGRVIRLARASFTTAGGRGRIGGSIDLTRAPAVWAADVALLDAALQTLAPRLPPALQRLRGSCSLVGQFQARGLTREQLSASFEGGGTLRLKSVYLGDFDPLAALARKAGWGLLEPLRAENFIRSSVFTFRARDRKVFLESNSLELTGATLRLQGTYGLDGAADFDVAADLRSVNRRWLDADAEAGPALPTMGNLHLVGAIDQLAVAAEGQQVSRVIR